jgi:hypothetical protein
MLGGRDFIWQISDIHPKGSPGQQCLNPSVGTGTGTGLLAQMTKEVGGNSDSSARRAKHQCLIPDPESRDWSMQRLRIMHVASEWKHAIAWVCYRMGTLLSHAYAKTCKLWRTTIVLRCWKCKSPEGPPI